MADYASMNQQDILSLLLGNPQFQQLDLQRLNFQDPEYMGTGMSQWGMNVMPDTADAGSEEWQPFATPKSFTVPLTGDIDPTGGGKFGRYVGKYDASGKLVDVGFEPRDRSGGWLAENIEWVGPALVGAAMAFGGGLFSGIEGAGGEGSVFGGSGAEVLGEGFAEPLAGEFAFLDPAPFTGLEGLEVGAAASAGAATVPPPVPPVPPTPPILPQLAQGAAVASGAAGVVDAIGGPGPSLDPQIPAGVDDRTLDQILNDTGNVVDNDPFPDSNWTEQELNDVFNDPTFDWSKLPSWAKTAWDAVKGTAGGLGQFINGLTNAGVNFAAANQIKDKLFDLGDELKGEYQPALDYIKGKGTFTPYAMRSPFATVDNAGNSDVSDVYKDILSQSNPVAQQSFAAAGNFDYEQNAQDEYDLMMQILGPDFEREQLATEARMARQGRLGIDNAPELTALEKAQADQRLKAMLSARTTGLNRRGEMIQQGSAALQPSLSVWKELQAQQGLAGQYGAYAAQAQNSNNNTWAQLFDNMQRGAFSYKDAGTKVASDAITAAARPVGQAAGNAAQGAWDWLFK